MIVLRGLCCTFSSSQPNPAFVQIVFCDWFCGCILYNLYCWRWQ